ncbi:hypothetical protein J4475_01825 [Candidatus Woesearchaeota archaeon]|nr:hypothetical protein [Candidatus Woesearchaeota archaeon]
MNLRFALMLGLLILVFAVAVQAGLEIEQIDVKVNNTLIRNVSVDGLLNESTLPGQTVEVRIMLINTDAQSTVDNIDIKGTLSEVQEDADLEDEASLARLSPGDTARKTLRFDIPKAVRPGLYHLFVEIGAAMDGNDISLKRDIFVNVVRKSHDADIQNLAFDTTVLSCIREAILSLDVVNWGAQTEDRGLVKVRSPELGLDINQTGQFIRPDKDGDEKPYHMVIPIRIKDNVEQGVYSIMVEAYYGADLTGIFYNENYLLDDKRIQLAVQDCPQQKAVESSSQPAENDTGIVIVAPEPPKQEQKKSFWQGFWGWLMSLLS